MDEMINLSQSQAYDILEDPVAQRVVTKMLTRFAKERSFYKAAMDLYNNDGGNLNLHYAENMRLLACTPSPRYQAGK